MLSALGNGVKGGKWFNLMDKATRLATLTAAWQKVASNGESAGVDRQSIERFAAKSDEYLNELSQALEERSYQPATGQASRNIERRRQDEAAGDTHGQRPHRPDGIEIRTGTDL